MKNTVIRTPLSQGETYVDRLRSACNAITDDQCKNYVRHAKSFWLRAIQGEDL